MEQPIQRKCTHYIQKDVTSMNLLDSNTLFQNPPIPQGNKRFKTKLFENFLKTENNFTKYMNILSLEY